ncbi:MAG: protease inhibitor I42 family protein [Victivallaceae bacterium]|nr:protease inhibitor I42 family protein [Victivallaceae bacterium]
MKVMFVPLLALAAALAGCVAATTPTEMVSVGQFEGTRQRSFKLEKDATLTLELFENATTGYIWNVVSNEDICKVTQEHLPAESADGMCGAPGKCIVRITALKPGLTIVRLDYARPWETGAVPASRLICNIEVK